MFAIEIQNNVKVIHKSVIAVKGQEVGSGSLSETERERVGGQGKRNS